MHLLGHVDPPVRADGLCVVCDGERKTTGLKPLYAQATRDDPFCSAPCARRWHGVELSPPAPFSPRGYTSPLPPAA